MPAKPRILVVEDEFLVCQSLIKQLENLGYEVAGTAENGAAGVAKALELKPDLVLMDIGMPVMDGIEACRQIRAACPLPVVVLSAYSDRKRLGEIRSAGAAGYVTKPTADHELKQAVEKALAKSREAEPETKPQT